jgi:phage tail-like protein
MTIQIPDGQDTFVPFPGFAFFVNFKPAVLTGAFAVFETSPITGAFSEVTGLEATMEPKVIKEGGRNYGPLQRPGPVSFSTVVLKRGVVLSRHLWSWWAMFAGSDGSTNGGWGPGGRANVDIVLIDAGQAILGWELVNAMPIKFRAPDFNARGTEVAIEELHLAHEGLNTAPVS